ncbi:root meristem growth factor-like protein [Arabidopsis thaliana]|uniref:Root meristem growth factor-like protein n=1 Tax=Arabidopsis thaliana TaxID=3702 RepID=A0A1P8AUC9_ARATH|nr:root meristem growth factor-like protein [Arabidopsis thaliana]ANM60240.1 root meristem growth factor-like protein [Arabidopsis thaliana]|eukprot:NP_001322540.1 root meristem growth factor-like protein [Arabidopsis thaliana]
MVYNKMQLINFCPIFSSGDKDEVLSVDVGSNAKVMKHLDGDDAMKKAQVRGRSGQEFSKETTKMMMKKTTKKETNVEEEDDLVAYTADYWKPRHHPPKNN